MQLLLMDKNGFYINITVIYKINLLLHINESEQVKLLSCVRLFVTPWTVAHQDPPFMEFSRQEYWSGLPFPSPGDLPNPGIEHGSPALQADALSSGQTHDRRAAPSLHRERTACTAMKTQHAPTDIKDGQ